MSHERRARATPPSMLDRISFMPGVAAMPSDAAALSLAAFQQFSDRAAFNRWSGIEIVEAEAGRAVIEMPWRPELGQYAGFMHAGIVGALIDTACGCAAATVSGHSLLASHYAVNCLRPAVGERFSARARVVKPGRSQVFTACELYALAADGKETLVATGETLLVVGAS
jgi:uncharacterized protein (TIGR00369 family)